MNWTASSASVGGCRSERREGDDEHQGGRAVVEQALGVDERDQAPRARTAGASSLTTATGSVAETIAPTRNASFIGSPVATCRTTATTAADDEDAGHGQEGDAAERPAQLVAVEPVGGLEDEARQEDRDPSPGRHLHRSWIGSAETSSPTRTRATV